MDLDTKARLLMGLDISVQGITIKNYTIGEIFKDVGLTKYLQMSTIPIKKVNDYISPEHIDKFKGVEVFDIFCISGDMSGLFIKFLNLFTKYEWQFICNEMFIEFYARNEFGKSVHVNKGNIEEIFEAIKVMYCLESSKKESDREDISNELRDMLKELEEEEAKVNASKKSNITLVSMIDGITSKHNSINLLNIWDYKMYQIIHTYHAIEKIDNQNRTMSAIYAGTIDSKKIDMEKIHWANES